MSNLSTKNPKIFVVILNFDGGEDLLKTLESVADSDLPTGQVGYENLEIVLVDNGSTDNSLKLAKQWVVTHCSNESKFSKVHFIENEKNLGFGAGNNVGIKFAFENGADFVFLLNNDALVQKNTISNLVDSIENKENVGLVSPVIYSDLDYEKVWFCGGKVNWWKMRAEHFDFEKNVRRFFTPLRYVQNDRKDLPSCRFISPRNDVVLKTEYVTGCAMLISREVFEKVGLFDERIFLYYEDTDLSLRVEKAGLKNFIVLNSKVYHAEKSEGNQPKKIYYLVFSGVYFFKKHAKGFWEIYLGFYLLLRKFKNFLDVKFRPNEVNLAVRRAYLDGDKT